MADPLDVPGEVEEKVLAKAEKGKGKKGGKGGGGGGANDAKKREVQISRALSRLLRHQAENAGLKLDEAGFVELDKVMAWQPLRSIHVTFDDILTAVHNNEKQRFSMKPNPVTNPTLAEDSTDPSHFLIRANQGHSIALASEAVMTPITIEAGNIPALVVHGTYFCFWRAILESGGLKAMGRNHVHCCTGLPGPEGTVKSGMRKDAELLIYLDVEESLRDGAMKWWMSDNEVVLTEGDDEGLVPVKYFKEVVGRSRDVGVLVQGGEVLADIPAGVKGIVPQGKGRGSGRGGKKGGRGGGGAGGSSKA